MSTTTTVVRKGYKRKRTGTGTARRRLFTGGLAKRPRYANLQRQTVVVGRGPVAQKTIVSLKYTSVWTFDGITFDKRFNLNSIFAPEYSGGTQPLGRDQYATFYNRYRVLKCRVKILAHAASGGQKIVCIPDNSPAAFADMSIALQQRDASVHQFMSIPGQTVIKRTFYPHRITGVSKKDYGDDRFQAVMTASPTEQILLHVCQATVDNVASAANAVLFTIELHYSVELFDPLPLAGS